MKEITVENLMSHTKETYEVLAADTSVKNGHYKRQEWSRLVTMGFYKNNKKDSIWTSYGPGKRIASQGSYKDGVRSGTWLFYNYKNELADKYVIETNKRIYHMPDLKTDTIKYRVISGQNSAYMLLDHPPVYAGGEGRITQLLVSTVRYPSAAKEHNTTGKVIIAVTIDETGHATDYRIKQDVKDGIGQEALRVAMLIEDDWLPGILNNKPVTTEYTFPISFSLSSN